MNDKYPQTTLNFKTDSFKWLELKNLFSWNLLNIEKMYLYEWNAFGSNMIYTIIFPAQIFWCYGNKCDIQSNFGPSNSPVSNTRDRSNLFLGPRSRQFPHTFNVKIHSRLEQRWLELSNSKHGPQGDFSCKNALMARTEYFFTWISHTLNLSSLLFS